MSRPALRHRRLLFCALLAALSLAAGGRFLFSGLPIGVDHTLAMGPWLSLHWNGGPPLFDPYTLSGVPLYSNLQAALAYPLRWPFFFLSDWRDGYPLYCFLHVAIAIFGAFAFARGLRLSFSASLLVAILFGCGGYLAGRPINPVILFASAWLPWLLLGASGGRPMHRWATTISFAMILAVGSPHLYIYGAIGYAIVALGLRRFCLRRLAWQALHLAIGALFVAPALIPGLRAVGGSVRSGGSILENLADSVPPDNLPQVFLGGTGGAIYPEFIDHSAYIGAVASLLVLFAIFQLRRWRDPRFRVAFALAVVGLFIGLGKYVGLQYILPMLPGLHWLTAPNRALVLTALGAPLMAGLMLDRIGHRVAFRLALAAGAAGVVAFALFLAVAGQFLASAPGAPSIDLWIKTWILAPAAVDVRLFLWIDAAMALLPAALLFFLFRGRPVAIRYGLIALALFQCLHFVPRVEPPMRPRAFYDPPPGVGFLMQQAKADPAPFRVFGYDPLRIHNADVDNRFVFQFLVPQVSALFGLEDIQGFDPLIPERYAELIQKTSGRSPINDPLRNLDLAWPEPGLLEKLGVRYLLGHPYDRRASNLPLSISGGAPAAEVQPTEPWPKQPVTDYLFVSLLDGPIGIPIGAPVARLHIDAVEGAFDFPIRNGIETAHVNATNFPNLLADPAFLAIPNTEWQVAQPIPAFGYQVKSANYRGRVAFGRPLTIRAVRWESLAPETTLVVLAQACRLQPPATDDPWRLAFGSAGDVAPVYEFLPAADRAVLIPGDKPNSQISIPLHGPPGVEIQWSPRQTNSMALRISNAPAGLLVFRQLADPNWAATIDGRPAPIEPVGDFFGVRLPGSARVELTCRPASGRLIWPLLGLAGTGALLATQKKRKRLSA